MQNIPTKSVTIDNQLNINIFIVVAVEKSNDLLETDNKLNTIDITPILVIF